MLPFDLLLELQKLSLIEAIRDQRFRALPMAAKLRFVARLIAAKTRSFLKGPAEQQTLVSEMKSKPIFGVRKDERFRSLSIYDRVSVLFAAKPLYAFGAVFATLAVVWSVVPSSHNTPQKIRGAKSFKGAANSCESAIRNEYTTSDTDRYGNAESSSVWMLNFITTHTPGMHPYGNYNAKIYTVVIEKRDNKHGQTNRIAGRENFTVYCMIDKDGSVVGIERDYK